MREPVYPSDLWQKRYMRQLADQIREWKHQYYYQTASVDDATYDLWWHNLLFMEEKYPHLKDPNSPTVSVGSAADGSAIVLIETPRKLTLAEMETT